jgi:hypothetical protein
MRVAHEGNTRSSPEEAKTIAALVEDLLKGEYVKQDGTSGPLAPEEIMVVAPYNAQVRCLSEYLPEGVRIGTVDKFQGQEAAVCFFSMATSSGEEIPRHLEFLFSRNRLNVAISRARCLAVLVCNPALLNIRCNFPQAARVRSAVCVCILLAAAAFVPLQGVPGPVGIGTSHSTLPGAYVAVQGPWRYRWVRVVDPPPGTPAYVRQRYRTIRYVAQTLVP